MTNKNVSITIAPKQATESGALDGFQVTCSCGFVCANSLKMGAHNDAGEHIRWHNQKDKKGGK